jgi:F-type H+-transporting ATPase subunit delta
MARKAYARRYAQAAFDIARGKNELDRWQSDLRKIAALAEDAELMAVLESPKIHFEDKAKLLAKGLGDINPLALNLVFLLVTRGRVGMLADIADEYQSLLDSYRGIEQAEVVTAVPLDDEDRKRLEERLEKMVGKKVVLKAQVDPGVLGGVVARIGGRLLDGSTRSKLLALKKALASGEVR